MENGDSAFCCNIFIRDSAFYCNVFMLPVYRCNSSSTDSNEFHRCKVFKLSVVQYITSVFKYTSNICHLGEDY